MTLQDEFDHFLQSVYKNPPRELDPERGHQYRALRYAFFGGALVAQNPHENYLPELLRWREALQMGATFLRNEEPK